MEDKLKNMFEAQKALVEKYVALGKMPKFPVKLSEKAGQKALKELGGFFIEELSEMNEEYMNMYLSANLNLSEDLQVSTVNFKEELADCFHFLLEILIYSGITKEGLQNLIDSYSPMEHIISPDSNGSLLNEVFTWANQANAYEVEPATKLKNAYPVSLGEYNHRVGVPTIEIQSQFLWNIIHKLKQGERLLKNKPWRETDTPIDYQAYERSLFEVFLMFIRTAAYVGFNADILYSEYMKKNEKNLERIKNGY